jgi:hypothetical protein
VLSERRIVRDERNRHRHLRLQDGTKRVPNARRRRWRKNVRR